MRMKRIIALLMTVTLLAGEAQLLSTRAQAAETEPEVIISGVNVTTDGTENGTQTGYLELSLHVIADGFQTVGAVLSYDPAVLTPVQWATDDPVTVNSTLWTAVVPSKGADDFSGKPVLARLKNDQAPVTPPETEETQDDVPTADETPAQPQRGYLYLGAESLVYRDLPAAANTRLVTVRFKIQQDEAGQYLPVTVPEADGDLTDSTKTICLAPEADAEWAAPGAQVMLTRGEPSGPVDESVVNPDALDGYTLKYYAWRTTTDKYAANEESPCKVSFRTGPGATINTGTAGPVSGGAYAVTFFDWDGRVLDAITADQTLTADQLSTVQTLQNGLLKPGYRFDQWLVVYQTDNGLKAKYGSYTSRKGSDTAKFDAQDAVDFTDLSKCNSGGQWSVLLQACYTTVNDAADGTVVNNGRGDGADLGTAPTYYTFHDPSYYQYGTAMKESGNYAVRCKVDRLSVLRADEPFIAVEVCIGSETAMQIVNLRVDLENTDQTQFEVVVPKNTYQVTYMVRDGDGVENWTVGQARTGKTIVKGTKIVRDGAFSMLVAETIKFKTTNTWAAAADQQCFQDAGYTGVNDTNLAQARGALAGAATKDGDGNWTLTAAVAAQALKDAGFTRTSA